MNTDTEFSHDEQATLDALAQLPPIEPPGDIRERFRERAATEHAVGPAPRRWITVGLAAALVLAVGGGWWVDRANEERKVAALSAQLTAALQDLSAATRYRAVTAAGQAHVSDARIVTALTKSLLSDSSTNVRVASAEALGRIAAPSALFDAARESIRRESSPFVQAALLTATAGLPAASRIVLHQALLSRPDLDPLVRAQVEQDSRT